MFDRGFCDGLITRPEVSYQGRRFCVWPRSASRGGHDPESRGSSTEVNNKKNIKLSSCFPANKAHARQKNQTSCRPENRCFSSGYYQTHKYAACSGCRIYLCYSSWYISLPLGFKISRGFLTINRHVKTFTQPVTGQCS